MKTLYVYSSNSVTGTASQLQLSASSIEPTSGPLTGNIPTQLTITLNNRMTIVWDGTSDNGGVVPSGQYFIEASEQEWDRRGDRLDGPRHGGVGYGELRDGEYPGGTERFERGNGISGDLHLKCAGLTLDYRIYDTAGELVLHRTPGNSGSSSAQWDAAGKASGLYFAVVDATNAQGGLIGYKILKIVVVH